MSTNPEGFEDGPVPVRPLDGDQARLLEILRAARGAPVAFADLREQGIENPAVLCYELEIAGVPITHVERGRPGVAPVPVGVQLDERWFAPLPEPTPAPRFERVLGWRSALAVAARSLARDVSARRPRSAPAGRTWTGLLLAACALALVAALLVVLGSGSNVHEGSAGLGPAARRSHHAPARGLTHRPPRVARGAPATATVVASSSTHTEAGADGASRATQLQSEGHQLLAEGRFAAAAADERAAIAASGGSASRCQEPSTESCLAYAYALYDLGRALQEQHEPAAAVPVLDERLRIDNQRRTVLAQLNSARQQAQEAPPRTTPAHRKHAGIRAGDHSSQQSAQVPAPQPSGSEASGEAGPGNGQSPESSTHGGAAGPPGGTSD